MRSATAKESRLGGDVHAGRTKALLGRREVVRTVANMPPSMQYRTDACLKTRSAPPRVAQGLRGTRVRDAFSECVRFGCPNRVRSSSVAISKFTKVASTSRI